MPFSQRNAFPEKGHTAAIMKENKWHLQIPLLKLLGLETMLVFFFFNNFIKTRKKLIPLYSKQGKKRFVIAYCPWSGCSIKIPWTGKLKQWTFIFLTVLGNGGLRLGDQQIWFPIRMSLLSCRCPAAFQLQPCMVERECALVYSSAYKDINLNCRALLSWHSHDLI